MARNEKNTSISLEDAQLRKNLKGAINVIYHTYNSMLVRSITKAKRGHLDKKIRSNIKSGKSGRVGRINYLTPRIITLKIILIILTLSFKIFTRFRQAVIA